MRSFIRTFCAVALAFSMLIAVFSVFAYASVPDKFYVTPGTNLEINYPFKLTADLKQKNVESVQAAAVDLSEYSVDLNMMGVIPVKETTVEVKERQYVIPKGTPFGIKMYTRGVIVVGMTDVDGANGPVNPAKLSGIKEGDVILSIDGYEVNTTEDVAGAFEGSDGKSVSVVYCRGDTEFKVEFTPIYSKTEKRYKAGLWVRDSSAGIGMMTYYDPDTDIYAGLGHAVCDVDVGEIMPLMTGTVVPATITGVYKGKSGDPGELCGTFSNEERIGSLEINNETGVYGRLSQAEDINTIVPVAFKQEIQEGKAQILTTIEGDTPQYYDIEITKIYLNSDSVQKNMIIKVTDETLLENTGGIVQGMSGSPIIQNGMFVGAVTHVFVNNPAQGYAIFAENMINTSNNLYDQLQNQAS